MSLYLPVLVQICLAAGIAIFVVALSSFLGQRRQKTTILTDRPYECGVRAEPLGHFHFNVKFYVTAMLFLLLDIEVVFLFPWVFIYREFLANHIAIFVPMLVFIGLLVLGLIYEVKKGALDWER